MDYKMKNCPFCGSDLITLDVSDHRGCGGLNLSYSFALCKNCGARSREIPYDDNYNAEWCAAMTWNIRPDSDNQQ